MIYTTACAEKKPGALDFVPLKIDYQERFSSAGMTSGGYNKRDGRPSEKEVLVGRLIDRPIRPMIMEGWTHETQLLLWVVSYDGSRPPEPLSITSASAALCLSQVPLKRPVAGVTVAMNSETGGFIVNPDKSEADKSPLNLTMAGTEDGVLMIEGSCHFLTEEQMIEAISIGHKAVKIICKALREWSEKIGRPKRLDTLRVVPHSLIESFAENFQTKIDDVLSIPNKTIQSESISIVNKEVYDMFDSSISRDTTVEHELYESVDISVALKKLWSKQMRKMIINKGTRSDGRKVDEVRPITIETSVLPRTHGSALFTRGETQALATITLGDSSMVQKMDSIDGLERKRFYLQYTFPPSCVGEVGRTGSPSRREIGHGNLAERALSYIIPAEEKFPYSIRVESLITESSGSSSMASICGGCLAMMDGGVPIERPVAGVAMGLLLNEDSDNSVASNDGVILTDILGLEDAFGTMDFKVAGDRKAITSFQLDIKCEGLTVELLTETLEQAKKGRMHILDEMLKCMPQSKPTLSEWVPIFTVFKVPSENIGRIIGPGGKQIRQIIEDFSLTNVDVAEDGTVFISSMENEYNERAEKYIQALAGVTSPPRGSSRNASSDQNMAGKVEVGKIYKDCTVKGIHNFGCFVEILNGIEGLVHISELDSKRIRTVEGFVNVGDKLDVKLININEKGQLRLSRKAAILEIESSVVLSEKNQSHQNEVLTPTATLKTESSL